MTKPIMSIKILEDFTTYTDADDDWITEHVPEAWEAREVLNYIAELEAENDRLQDAWFKDETICPDGSLKPKVSTLLSRIAELTECIGSQMADVYTLKARIAELEATVEIHADISNAYEKRISEIVSLSNKANAKLQSRIAELKESDKHWAGNVKVCMQLIERYESAIAELEEKQRWIPVSERLPEEDTDGNALMAICRYSGEWVRTAFGAEFADEFVRHYTHWMYAPQPPEVQESEATSCKFCGSNKSDRRMNSIVCTSCGRKIGNIAPPEVK